MPDAPPRALPACLASLAFLGGAVVLFLSDALPLRLSFLTPERFHGVFLATAVAFVLWVWPFLGRPGEGGRAERLGRAGLPLLLALPLLLVAANLSAAGPGPLLRGLLLLAALAALVTALPAGKPVDLAASLFLSCGLPFVAFVAGEFGGADLGWLAALSPLWAAVEIGRGPDLACAGLAALAAGILLAAEGRKA